MANAEVVKVVGYKLTRPESGNTWMFAGTTPEEVAKTVACEIENNEGLSPDECGRIVIEAYETTQAEIDNMPEFPGW